MGKETAIQWSDASLFTGKRRGRVKQFCKSIGIAYDEYLKKVAQKQKWCTGCKEWHPLDMFGVDISRFDGLTSVCLEKKNLQCRQKYIPKPRPKPGRKFVYSRDNDKKQARRRVNYLVEQGLIPHPNKIPCVDCGHIHVKGERRHEYDHFKGYAPKHHETVESVCSICHKKRTNNGVK